MGKEVEEAVSDAVTIVSSAAEGFVTGGPVGGVVGAGKGASKVAKRREAKEDAEEEAAKQREQADLEMQDALDAANIRKEQGERFKAQQGLGFTASGVRLEGTPLEILEQTQQDIETELTQAVTRAESVKELRLEQAERVEHSADASIFDAISSGVGILPALLSDQKQSKPMDSPQQTSGGFESSGFISA